MMIMTRPQLKTGSPAWVWLSRSGRRSGAPSSDLPPLNLGWSWSRLDGNDNDDDDDDDQGGVRLLHDENSDVDDEEEDEEEEERRMMMILMNSETPSSDLRPWNPKVLPMIW